MKKLALYFVLAACTVEGAMAQVPKKEEPFFKKENFADSIKVNPGYKTKLLPSLIVPALLIGYGLTTIKDNGIYSDYDMRRGIKRTFGDYSSTVDNYLIFSPYVEFALLLALKVKCKNDVVNTALLIAKSEVIMLALTFSLKYMVAAERPYSYGQSAEWYNAFGNPDGAVPVPLEKRKEDPNAFVSMPSGHTAHAFMAATIVQKEFRYKSQWYGVGAYVLAGSVAAFRMINDQHWQSDVLVGAGIGVLSANLVYATHLHRWGRKEVCLMPTFNNYSRGISMVCTF